MSTNDDVRSIDRSIIFQKSRRPLLYQYIIRICYKTYTYKFRKCGQFEEKNNVFSKKHNTKIEISTLYLQRIGQ